MPKPKAERSEIAKKAASTRKRRRAGKKAALTRKRRSAAKRAVASPGKAKPPSNETALLSR